MAIDWVNLMSSQYFLMILAVLIIWEMVWKGIALWKSGKNNQIVWFICIFLVNTIGILPIIYLVWFQENPKSRKK